MYAASVPLENNPVVDDHFVGVIVMIVLALGAAGTTWGLGKTELVKKHAILQ
jgi:thiosulfate dehydrogenase [quinone] large subunit